ncbi:HD-GYP domain-containing protein [Treponema pedis]|uniref:HD-GYP domain-containing protein n=1 Tax=Treponema pedis str. T A4 TaxID=1291379 RepID=S5ZPX4_9SPIR|nr:HD-GYP domain-containing protein [Treponema pedis]AGT44687.1 hypothetical protein TPE_2213 [Treponema pedis str. T A4]
MKSHKSKRKKRKKSEKHDAPNAEKLDNLNGVNEIGEIEELDTVDPVTELTQADFIQTSEKNPIDKTDIQTSLSDENLTPVFKNAMDLLASPIINCILLDKNFIIKHINPIVHDMFYNYYTLKHESFFNVFGKTLEKDDLDTLLKKLKDPDSGFSWTGVLIHKTKYYKTMYTKTHIFPLFETGLLSGYWVIFENITDVYFEHYKNMLNSLLNASKLKDNDTGFHNERLNHYSKILAEAMFKTNLFQQIDADFIDNISSLAQIHDIGKIGTPDYILQKNGSLTPVEWKIMKEHTINGTLILAAYPIPMAKEIALSHHERWNGTGYPYGLAGDMIPLSARIVAVADVYDALRMKRSYKESMPHTETVANILNGSGSHFDPNIIEIFKTVADDFNEIWETNKDGSQT